MNTQLIPAVGWVAVYENEGTSVARPLVGWLKEPWEGSGHFPKSYNGPDWVVSGLVADGGRVVYAQGLEGFSTYEYDLDSASIDYLALKNGS